MRTEPITEDTIAEYRKQAAAQPATGLPKLARSLQDFGWQIDRNSPAKDLPYFEEAATIYRHLLADGDNEHLTAAMHAISSLSLQYSLAHADELALAANYEATALARRVNAVLEHGKKTSVVADLAHRLAEFGQFAQAVEVELEVVNIYRAAVAADKYGLSDNLAWSLLHLAIFLNLDGQTEASLQIEHEALALQRRLTERESGRLPILAIWTAGASLRLASTGHSQQARELVREAIAACDQLPANDDKLGNFSFLRAIQNAHFARSGAQDEQSNVGVDLDQPLQPVFGLSFHHWSFSVRLAYRDGLAAMNDAIAASANPLPQDLAGLSELGTLLRRRNIRASVLSDFDYIARHFLDHVIPYLAHGVDIERALFAADPARGPHRLIRGLDRSRHGAPRRECQRERGRAPARGT
ncbi:hypothetical protein LWC34_05735 [Kibdelosporangium philippinense]|uniref:MalT-like TPR region domain-containing protein n=1 Tax=Kibdelosporangium philippinense TaxID=211113 RepID=A0ABS8Z328_9PSEU|nr:hypothetical protein [Kibdelosporangium philippinense]MCE7002333.1 hypothetical protein [Kibdelosporangium philippinense]